MPNNKGLSESARKMIEQAGEFTGDKVNNQPIEPVSFVLPACVDDKRPVPNALLRGGLFSVVSHGRRKFEENTLKASVNGVTIRHTGHTLAQSDLDVWMECVRLYRGAREGEKIHFSSRVFLRSIGRSQGKANREWLYKVFRRLMSSVIEVGDGRFFYTGQLINHWYRDDETGKNALVLNQKLAVFFENNLWTGLSFEQRIKLKSKPIAQWLHSFYSTHDEPVAYKIETVAKLCGSDYKSIRMFKGKLLRAIESLSEATGWDCWINEDKVFINKREAKDKKQ